MGIDCLLAHEVNAGELYKLINIIVDATLGHVSCSIGLKYCF